MKKIILLSLTIASTLFSLGQADSLAMKYAATITADELREHLSVLASDEYEGRETGMKGQKMAAEYISKYFESLNIPPCNEGSYYQEFPLKTESSMSSTMNLGPKEYKYLDDFFFFPGFEAQKIETDELVFAGYGIMSENYSDYKGLDVKGKTVLIMEGEPFNKEGKSLINGSDLPSEWSSDWRLKREKAQELGVKSLIVVKQKYSQYLGRVKFFLQSPSMRLDYEEQRGEKVIPVIFISKDLAEDLIIFGKGKPLSKVRVKISKKKKTLTQNLATNLSINVVRKLEKFSSENILAYIEGSDSVLKNELVVITAHYDHVGITDGEIYNGADDDGSGTVTALEITQAFKTAKNEGNGPRRSVLVMTVSGEEKGLLGSEWYSEYPIFPLENTICDLNIDMIGRTDAEHEDANYVYLIGSDKLSTELHSISEEMNATYTNMALDYTYNAPDDPNRFYYRSDHYNFAKNNIPVIFYFSGVHEDYHQPGDDVDKIMFDKTANIGRLIFHTAWQLANQDKRIEVNVENDFEEK